MHIVVVSARGISKSQMPPPLFKNISGGDEWLNSLYKGVFKRKGKVDLLNTKTF